MADSALSTVSTSMACCTRMRERKRRADLESSTIKARLAPMPAPKISGIRGGGECSAETPAIQLACVTLGAVAVQRRLIRCADGVAQRDRGDGTGFRVGRDISDRSR